MVGLVLFVIIVGNAAVTGWLVARYQSLRDRLEDVDECVSWLGQQREKDAEFFNTESPVVEVTPDA